MSNFNMHTIKRAARKEAWYGDSYNPFRKTSKKSNTWAQPGAGQRDVEAARDVDDEPPLSAVASAPAGGSNPFKSDEAMRRRSKEQEQDMTSARGVNGRPSDPESENTGEHSSRPPSEEVKARRRFVGKFFHRNKHGSKEKDEEDPNKKQPWYKGKKLEHEPFTIRNQLQRTIFNSWINILLVAAPAGIAVKYAGVDGKIIFVVNFIAIIPLAGLLSFATEEIALYVGESLGGLLNASFGNAVEMIVAIIALAKDEVVVVQTSLIGSILSNLLLVMGMCFFFGGLQRIEQYFNQTVAQTAASLLALAVGSVIIPTCFKIFSPNSPASHIAGLSRGTAIILLVVYGCYLYFQLHTHMDMFQEESKKVARKPGKHALPDGALSKGLAKVGGMGAGPGRAQMSDRPPNDELVRPTAYEEQDDTPEPPQLHVAVAWLTLGLATAVIGVCADFMVDGIAAVTASGAISVEFVGLILLPIVGNAAEHATAVTVACKDKMDLAIGVAVGSSMQVALLLIPLMVVIGWIMGREDMTLSFDGFQVAVLFVAVLLVNYIVGDGKSNWIEGMTLQCLYIIIAVCAWYYPATNAV